MRIGCAGAIRLDPHRRATRGDARCQQLFGASYDFRSVWGVSQMRFEVFTLGTLVIVIVFALVFYALGADVRRRAVDVSLVPAGGAIEEGV